VITVLIRFSTSGAVLSDFSVDKMKFYKLRFDIAFFRITVYDCHVINCTK